MTSWPPSLRPGTGFAGGIPELDWTVIQDTPTDSPTGTTITLSSVSLGASTNGNKMIIVVGQARCDSTDVVNSATIAGVSATIHVSAYYGGSYGTAGDGCRCFIFSALTGATTGDIVVTFNAAVGGTSFGWGALEGWLTRTPYHTASNGAAVTGDITTSLNIPIDGMAVAGHAYEGAGGVELDYSVAPFARNGVTRDGADYLYAWGDANPPQAGGTGVTVNGDIYSGTQRDAVIVAASWR